MFLICLERPVELSYTKSGAPHCGDLIELPRPISVFQKHAFSLSLSLSLSLNLSLTHSLTLAVTLSLSFADATQLTRLIRMDVIC